MAEETSGKAVASLVLGILGLVGVLPCVGSILAIVLGAGEESGAGNAGRILGWIGLVLNLLVVFLLLGFLFLGGSIAFLEGM
jgi:hypothetical protein